MANDILRLMGNREGLHCQVEHGQSRVYEVTSTQTKEKIEKARYHRVCLRLVTVLHKLISSLSLLSPFLPVSVTEATFQPHSSFTPSLPLQ